MSCQYDWVMCSTMSRPNDFARLESSGSSRFSPLFRIGAAAARKDRPPGEDPGQHLHELKSTSIPSSPP